MTLFGLFGCVTTTPKPGPDSAFDYTARGKIALRQDKKGFSANFHWRQKGEGYVVDVWGPLGQGRIQLSGTPRYMEIRRGGDLLASGVPGEVMQQHLGWVLPVEIVPAWLHGAPLLTQTAFEQEDTADGRLSRLVFEELSWRVDMSRFAPAEPVTDESGRMTPRRIVALSGKRRMTIVVREFSLFTT